MEDGRAGVGSTYDKTTVSTSGSDPSGQVSMYQIQMFYWPMQLLEVCQPCTKLRGCFDIGEEFEDHDSEPMSSDE